MVGLAGRFPDRWLLQLKQPAGQMECLGGGGPGRPGLQWSLQPEFKSPPLQMGDPGQFWVSRAGRQVHRDKRWYVARTGALAGRRNPPPAHLSAPAAVSLTARLGSSSNGPRRRTASRRARPGSTGRCCTSRASPAQAHSRTSALGCWSCGRRASVKDGAERRRRGRGRGAPGCPGAPSEPRPSRPLRAPASPFLVAPPPARRLPLSQSRSPLPLRPDSRP